MEVIVNDFYDACDVTLSVYPHRASLNWASFPPWSGIFFKLARCGYTLRVTSQASYSPEYITPTQNNHDFYDVEKAIHYITCNSILIYILMTRERRTFSPTKKMDGHRIIQIRVIACMHCV
jgi:hypothetical protein